MSWRETLGIAEPVEQLEVQNPHNAQKTAKPCHSADIAYSARTNAEDSDSRLLEALADACRGLSITPIEVRDALAPEDIEDWRNGDTTDGTLAAFSRLLVQRRQMDQGKCPAHYTERATCAHCGPIWLWFSGEVLGCPWCWNQAADRPIPRPHPVHCGDCVHFERAGHPHLGHCAKGEPEAIAGLWDTDHRSCERFLPIPGQTSNDPQTLTEAGIKGQLPK